MHIYNNEKKSLMLMHSPKILEVSQNISFYFDAIMGNNNNDNIRFSLREIMQAYIEIALNLNLNFYIRLLLKQIP